MIVWLCPPCQGELAVLPVPPGWLAAMLGQRLRSGVCALPGDGTGKGAIEMDTRG